MSRNHFRDMSFSDKSLVAVMRLFFLSAFLLIALRGDLEWQGLLLAVTVPLLLHAATIWLAKLYPSDVLLLSIANFLCALGILVLYVTDRGAETTRGLHQAIHYGAGILAMILCTHAVRHLDSFTVAFPVLLSVTVLLLLLPLVFGREYNGATNWIYLGSTSVQPSEIAKIPFLILTAYAMSRRRILGWLPLCAAALVLLMLQKDLGTALVYYITALILFYCSGGSLSLCGIGMLGGCGAAYAGYQMFSHVKKRVAIWLNPWQYSSTSGYQIVQSLMAIASGGLFGVGLGLGTPRVIPIYYSDCIFSVICEQFGVIFGAMVIFLYVIMILRGVKIATRARSSYLGLLAMGATAMLGIQTFIIIGGVLKLIPLTGVTMPFVSYGGSSLVSCMGLIGLLQGVNSVTQDETNYERQKKIIWSSTMKNINPTGQKRGNGL